VPNRLAVRLIGSLTAIVVVVEGTFALINLKEQERYVHDSMVLGADQLSRSLTSATWHAMLADQRDTVYEIMRTIGLKQGIDQIRIFNKEGRVTFSTREGGEKQVDKRAEACFLCHAEAQPLVRVDVPSRARIYRGPDGKRRLGLVTPIDNEPSCSAAPCHAHPAEQRVLGVLDVTLDLSPVDREMARIRFRTLSVLLVEVLLIGLFIVFFTRRFVGRPIQRLIEGTEAVSNMQLDRPIEDPSVYELGRLARAFNAMRERLREALDELNALNHTLEHRVEERTTQLRQTQEKLVQSERLASLGRLSATVAHEINNPVAGILNLAVLLQRIAKDEPIPPKRMPELRHHLGQIAAEASRVGQIVSDLLAFSRQAKPRHRQADLNDVVVKTVSLLSHKLALGEVSVRLDLQEGLPAVRGDASQLQQVVLNLVCNAGEAMPAGGEVAVSTRSTPDSGVAWLEVRDRGTGIVPEHLPKIFEPFFTTKEEGKGVGLGLAVTYGIVETHGGEIRVESREGEGTTFRVSLPLWAPGTGPAEEGE